ncbi:MAG: hypothetical protein ACOC8B_04965 [Gemmatimonadota bacterium]
MAGAEGRHDGAAVRWPPARLTLFGFASTPAEATVIRRSTSWRWTRALLSFAIGLGAAPIVAVLPPHLPWALLSVVAGVVIGVRRLRERVTLRSLRGRCPKCERSQEIDEARRLRRPHPLNCRGCGQELLLEVELEEDGPPTGRTGSA